MSLFGDGSIWDMTASSQFFTVSKISQLLADGNIPQLEEIMQEDTVIQDTQAQSRELLDFLVRPDVVEQLISYFSVARDVANEDLAYRFPYMASEIVACAVPRFLDAVTDRERTHLHSLFSFLVPTLAKFRKPTLLTGVAADQEHRPYLAGYFAKVVTVLVKKRPAALVRFLDRTPGIATGFISALHNGSIAALLTSLFDLPFHDSLGMGTLHLCRSDPTSIVHALLEAAGVPLTRGSTSVHQVGAADNAASVLVSLLATAKCASPHAKFAVEGYNAQYLGRRPTSTLSSDETAGLLQGGSSGGVEGNPAFARPTPLPTNAAGDLEFNVAHSCVLESGKDAAILTLNMQVDAHYHNCNSNHSGNTGGRGGERLHVRVLKALRDGEEAGVLVKQAVRAVQLLQSDVSLVSTTSTCRSSSSSQSHVEPTLRIYAAVLDATAYGFRQQVEFGFGQESEGIVPGTSPSLPTHATLGACPPILLATADALSVFTDYLFHIAHAASQANAAAAPAPPPSTKGAISLGIAALCLVRAVGHVVRAPWPEVAAAVARTRVFAALIAVMEAFPWHSILHRNITDVLVDALQDYASTANNSSNTNSSSSRARAAPLAPSLRAVLLSEPSLITAISKAAVAAFPEGGEADGFHIPPGKRPQLGYLGHILNVATFIAAEGARGHFAPGSPEAAFVSSPVWLSLQATALLRHNIQRGVLIGGLAPDTKKSGNVGSAADAAARPAAVDEVAAMDLQAGDDGDACSFSSGEGEEEEEAQRQAQQQHDEEEREERERQTRLQAELQRGGSDADESAARQSGFAHFDDEEESEDDGGGKAGVTAQHLSSFDHDFSVREDSAGGGVGDAGQDIGARAQPVMTGTGFDDFRAHDNAPDYQDDFGFDIAPAAETQSRATPAPTAGHDDFGFDIAPTVATHSKATTAPTASHDDFGFDVATAAATHSRATTAPTAGHDDFGFDIAPTAATHSRATTAPTVGQGDFGFDIAPAAAHSEATTPTAGHNDFGFDIASAGSHSATTTAAVVPGIDFDSDALPVASAEIPTIPTDEGAPTAGDDTPDAVAAPVASTTMSAAEDAPAAGDDTPDAVAAPVASTAISAVEGAPTAGDDTPDAVAVPVASTCIPTVEDAPTAGDDTPDAVAAPVASTTMSAAEDAPAAGDDTPDAVTAPVASTAISAVEGAPTASDDTPDVDAAPVASTCTPTVEGAPAAMSTGSSDVGSDFVFVESSSVSLGGEAHLSRSESASAALGVASAVLPSVNAGVPAADDFSFLATVPQHVHALSAPVPVVADDFSFDAAFMPSSHATSLSAPAFTNVAAGLHGDAFSGQANGWDSTGFDSGFDTALSVAAPLPAADAGFGDDAFAFPSSDATFGQPLALAPAGTAQAFGNDEFGFSEPPTTVNRQADTPVAPSSDDFAIF